MERAKGILYAALSSSTFGLAPLFTLLLAGGYSPFEALSYRWGVAALFPGALAVCSGRSFRLGRRELVTVFLLSLFRAATSLSLIIAYQHIASGVASTIYFMYPLAVALAMMCFFREKGSAWVFAAIGMSVVGAVLLSLGNVDFTVENSALGMVSACVSVFSSRSRASRHGPLQHDAGAGDQAHRADADFDFRSLGAADCRRHRRRGLRRTFYRAGGCGDSADRGRRERRRSPHRPPAAIGLRSRLSGRTDFAAPRRQICAGKGREETPA